MGDSDLLGFEKELWVSANKMRGKIDPATYRKFLIPLIYAKYICEKENKTHWSKLVKLAQQYNEDDIDDAQMIGQETIDALENIGNGRKKVVKTALNIMQRSFRDLDGVSSRVLADVIPLLDNFDYGDEFSEQDTLGRIYEYFSSKFAQLEQRGGEFYTPRTIVKLLVNLLLPFDGDIYDGCFGSGGMFFQDVDLIEHFNSQKEVSIYGQEMNPFTWACGVLNLELRMNTKYDLGGINEDTLLNDLHAGKKVRYCMTNPPFNIKDWPHDELKGDPRFEGYNLPPEKSANYAWILHHLNKLEENGYAAILMTNATLSTNQKDEVKIKEKLLENDKVDCIIMLPNKLFSNTPISASIWVLTNNKKSTPLSHPNQIAAMGKMTRDRSTETLFIDCREMGRLVTRKLRVLNEDEIKDVANMYHLWKSEEKFDEYQDIPGKCKSATIDQEIKEHDQIIVPGRYVGRNIQIESDESTEIMIEKISSQINENFEESKRLEGRIKKVLGDLNIEF